MIKILFLAANPRGTDQLRLDEEVRTIRERLYQAKLREEFAVEQEWAVRVSELECHLLRHRPHILHFSGHGSTEGEIILEDPQGTPQAVAPDALADLFVTLKDNIRCVVLNACFSRRQAEAIARSIDCVVGTTREIEDRLAIAFASGFYQALGWGRTVKTAFDLGREQIQICLGESGDIFQLLPGEGVHADALRLLPGRQCAMDAEDAIRILRMGVEGLREWNKRRQRGEDVPELRGADLRGADLTGANLASIDLSGATLREARLTGANLAGADLHGADLHDADLSGADLANAVVSRADLHGADLAGANLDGAKLIRADLQRTNLTGSNLRGADLSGADLRGATLTFANLGHAKLHAADLSLTILSGVVFADADLTGASLNQAIVRGTNFRGADLSGVSLGGAILQSAVLDQANLSGAFCSGTIFASVDLSKARGVEAMNHFTHSSLGTDTLRLSKWQIPEVFLTNCGVPEACIGCKKL